MGTRLWGPDMWYVIHVIADSAPDTLTDKDKEHYSAFYTSLANVLPCPSCTVHFKQFIAHDPPTFNTRVEMMQWTIRAHNHANKHTGKPELSEEDAFQRIEQEINARETGTVRGRLPTFIERLTDNAIPLTIIFILFVWYVLHK